MTTTSCPNCGKPLRPGARFCGNCGALIPEEPTAAQESQQMDFGMIACPNCGKPVREGAKFCNHCGKEIRQESSGLTMPPSRPTQPASKSSAIPSAAGEMPATAVYSTSGTGLHGKRKKKAVWPFLGAALVVVCIIGGLAGYFYFQDPFSIWATAAPSEMVISPSEISSTSTIESTITPAIPTAEPPTTSPTKETVLTSPTSGGISLVTEIPTSQPTTTIPVTSSLISTPALAPISSTSSIMLEDDFNEALSTNWKTWGDPRPSIRKGFGDNWLDLKAADKPGQSGVTSRLELENSPGNSLELEAQLNSSYPQYPLLFDWDPIQFDRGPVNTTPTIVHMEIQKSMTILQTPAANNSCQTPLDGTTKHIFVIKFAADKIVELYIDSSEDPACQLDMGIKPVPGRISFTGTGWLTRVLVTGSSNQ